MRTIRNIGFAFVMVSLFACGGNTSSKDNAENNSEALTEETTEEVDEFEIVSEEVAVEIIAHGETMAEIGFEPASFEVPAGSTVTLTFKNESSAAGMLHNFVLVIKGSGQEVAIAGIQAGPDNAYVPEDDRVIAHTEIVEMGNEIVFEFTAPSEPGDYEYICTYPGHYPGMVGTLTVK